MLRNLEGRDLIDGKDECYLACIKHANFDAMAGKLPLTIVAHLRKTTTVVSNAGLVNKMPMYQPRGHFPLTDAAGMGLAVDMLIKSLLARGCIKRRIKFSTIRRLRATYTKIWESSPAGVAEGALFAKGLGQICSTSCRLQSEWFYNFMRGMEYQMGCQLQPNHALLIGAIVHLLRLIEVDAREAKEAGSVVAANELLKIGAYVCTLMAAFLRGHEGFYLDLAGWGKHLHKGMTGVILAGLDKSTVLLEEMCMHLLHITICLLGKFKGETGVDHHLIPVANETTSGLCPRWWIEKLTEVCHLEGRFDGPAFASADGLLASSTDYDAML